MATPASTAPRRTKQPAARRTSTRRPASSSRGTRTTRTTAAKPAAPPTRSTAARVGNYAERAVLIPVGAALIARDRVVESVGEAISSYSTPSKAQSQLRKFERRGSTARNRLEREVRKTRTRLEREVRQRRRALETRGNSVTKSITKQVEETQAQIESAVRTRLEEGADLAGRIQERISKVV